MEDPRQAPGPEAPPAFGSGLAGATIAGGLLGVLVTVAAGFLLLGLGAHTAAAAFRERLAAGAWAWPPLLGAALGALSVTRRAKRRERLAALGLAAALALTPFLFRAEWIESGEHERPRTLKAKARSILRWSYRSPATVARILDLSGDPDPRVREQAVLALGVNLIVSDIEHATPGRPPRFAALPLRGRLRDRLLETLGDSVEAVRAEAARALWKAPGTFGRHEAAAETLAALLDRATRPEAVERFTWLALDGAAGAPYPRLKAAAARFASTTADTELRRAALEAARETPPH